MPHVLVLDWDPREIRYLLGMTSGRTTRLLALGTLSLSPAAEGPEQADQAFGTQLKELLSKYRATHPRVLVSLPRSSVDLLYLTLPPTADEELPELVLNLAVQQSPAISEQTRLDFLPVDSAPGSVRPVLAAALTDDQHQRLAEQLAAAGLTPQRMLLRFLGGISLFHRLVPNVTQTSLLIYRVGRDLELSVVAPGRLGFSRTVRLPGQMSDEDVNERLMAEAKRTVLASPRNQIGEEGIQQVVVLGTRAEYDSLAVELGNELSLPVEVLNPLGAIALPEAVEVAQGEQFAPLLGMLLDEAAGRHAIDLLHPRRPPPRWARWRLAAAGGGLLVLVILALVFYIWGNLSELNAENQRLAARLRELNETARKGVVQRKRIEAIAAWKNREVNWLDELRDLSERFPGPRDAVVLRMSMRPSQGAGGLIDLQGLVRDPKVVVNMERQVRDRFRVVRSRRVQQRTQEDDYTWLYETSVSVVPRPPEDYRGPAVMTAAADAGVADAGAGAAESNAAEGGESAAEEQAAPQPGKRGTQPVAGPAGTSATQADSQEARP